MKRSKRIRTVLYGDQRLSPGELEVLHTPAMQRLYGLRQLGLADRVFIDASHARIHHAVGVLEQADKLVSAIVANLRNSDRTLRIGASEKPQQTFSASNLAKQVHGRRPVVRLIGLLHDLTHAPFGHTLEDEIQLVDTKHDEPARQADAFYRLVCQLIAWLSVELSSSARTALPSALVPFMTQGAGAELPQPELVGKYARSLLSMGDPAIANACWRISTDELAYLLGHLRCAMTALLYMEALHKHKLADHHLPKEDEYHFQTALRLALEDTKFEKLLHEFDFVPNRDAYMLDVVGNTVCADLLDYAKRDSHFAGIRLDYDSDRIAENFTLVSLDASAYELSHAAKVAGSETATARSVPEGRTDPFAGWCLRTAISLMSHKYRTDVPSELMNLLNVRFYLYERAIYHPTKCAAGSMLGTALQLMGWRGFGPGGTRPNLPEHLRFVGDDVFLHDVRVALGFFLEWMTKEDRGKRIEIGDLAKIASVDGVHNGLVSDLLKLRVNQIVVEAQLELEAAKLMLDRLAARRYFRPVFRALPSSNDPRLQAGAAALANVFRQPDTRYEAERRIEANAGLPRGTITIHCPIRKTAEKIANVLLTRPGSDRLDEVCKLRDIGSLDQPTFGEHENAVQSVEKMYGSMWRLAVYVAPEHMPQCRQIGEAAGRVIFKTIDVHGQFADQSDISWPNDPQLERELGTKLHAARGAQSSMQADLGAFGNLIGQLGDSLIEAGKLTDLGAEYFGTLDELSVNSRQRVEQALVEALRPQTNESETRGSNSASDDRMRKIIRVFRTHATRPKRQAIDDFERRYRVPISGLSSPSFDAIVGSLQDAIVETRALDERAKGSVVHHGFQFEKLLEVLDELLKRQGISPPSKGDVDNNRNEK